MKRLKHLIAVLMIAVSGTFILMPVAASADFKSDACAGVNALNDSASGTCSASSTGSLDNIIKWVVNILSVIVGFAAVIMIIIGGFRFITSGGDSNNTAAARNTILYALVGLVIVALAQVIVHFTLNRVALTAQCSYNSKISATSSSCKPCANDSSLAATDKRCKT